MFVRADWTRRGLGRRILEACEAAARDEGFRDLTLVATLPGVPLYLAFGFQPVDELEVELPDGVRIDCVSMTKPIAAALKQPRRGFRSRGGGHHLSMSTYTKTNLNEVENQAPKFGMPSELEARFARTALGGETLGLSLMTLAPNFRIPFGHKHEGQEEVYVVLRGSARIKVEDEIVELGPMDALRIGMDTMRDVEAGPEGVEYIAFGAGDDPQDAEMVQDWWRE